MRIVAGLTGVAALLAFSVSPAIAECNWMKTAQEKVSPVASTEAPQTSLATNDLTDELIKSAEVGAQERPTEDTVVEN
jgi:hypothetical protein